MRRFWAMRAPPFARAVGLLGGISLAALAQSALAQSALAQTPPAPAPAGGNTVQEVVVTASRLNLLGVAATASQGSVTEKELDLRPVYRVGQLLESTPGLVVTVHSGEGKANQYLVRGFNLDHGTDIANFIDDMPINRPTNTHGQGYSDLNFELPEMAAGLDYTKGPYYASVGDFGAVASTHLKLANEIPDQIAVTGGTLGVYNIFAGGTEKFSEDDRLVGGLTYGHVDGPFDPAEDFRKYAGELRYSHGSASNGYSATLMYYKSSGLLTTDQPVEALQHGLIGRYGTLDPSDASSSERLSLSTHYGVTSEDWRFSVSAYYIHSRMVLWNDFTHYQDDPVNGDQEEQDETRTTGGGQASLTYERQFGAVQNEAVFGLEARFDDAWVDRRHTVHLQVLDYCSQENNGSLNLSDYPAGSRQNADGSVYYIPAINGNCQADRVQLLDLGPYIQDTTHWTHWLRTVVGLREEYYGANDQYLGVTAVDLAYGARLHGSQTLLQPKGSIVLGPFFQTEFYLSSGRGFHSDDVRGVFGTVPLEGVPALAGRTPLLAPAQGEEVGVRTNIIPKLQIQIAVFQEDFKSELRYDQDQGQDQASGPSRRQGVELSGEYRPIRWLEFNTDLAFSKARYQGSAATLADYGIVGGAFIANAPSFIGSFGILADHGPWFGGLQWRDLGPYPLTDGPQYPQDKGYSEFNADLGYRVNDHLTLTATGFNLLNTRANSSAYNYSFRVTPTAPIQTGDTFHPLEPISGQLKAAWTF
jgi:outer membrane receptor protein involved in Fe transport